MRLVLGLDDAQGDGARASADVPSSWWHLFVWRFLAVCCLLAYLVPCWLFLTCLLLVYCLFGSCLFVWLLFVSLALACLYLFVRLSVDLLILFMLD